MFPMLGFLFSNCEGISLLWDDHFQITKEIPDVGIFTFKLQKKLLILGQLFLNCKRSSQEFVKRF